MFNRLTNLLLRWIPADARQGVMQRAFIVWGVALAIAVTQWLAGPVAHQLDRSLVYSYAISTCIWLVTDPLRIALHPWLKTDPPHYWGFSIRMASYVLIGIMVGYAVGTSIGDAYAGQSTWQLMALSPQRFWGFWLSSLGISFGFIFYFSQRERAREAERRATEARLKLLESQLEPHMLFNTLANLRALIATDPARAIQMLDRLNSFLRATLQASRTDSNSGGQTLADEFARLQDYLELMAVRMGPRLHYSLALPDILRQHPVPPLLLQPLVENAIRHGLEPKVGSGNITVTASAQGNTLVLEVADSGIGMAEDLTVSAPSQAGNAGGFGLAQVRERVAGLPGGGGRVQLESSPGAGTTVRVELPLKSSA
jgi:signal transduction histidine kinase